MHYWRDIVRGGLKHNNGARQKTATYLGISIRFLRNVINAFPELKEEYPVRPKIENLKQYSEPREHRHSDLVEKRKFKSILKHKYKIAGREFEQISEIAEYYKVSMFEAEGWIRARMTADRDYIRFVSVPVDRAGNEVDPDDFHKMDSREWGK